MSLNPTSNSTQAVTWRLQVPDADTVVGFDAHFDSLNVGQDTPFESGDHLQVDPIDYQDGGKYRSIVKIQSRFENKETGDQRWGMGTGWLIRPDLLVTAGHNVFDHTNGQGPADQIKCWIGYNGSQSVKPSDVQTRYGVNVVTRPQLDDLGEQRRRLDIAFIQVDRGFKGNIHPFKFADTPSSSSSKIHLGVVGYPGDKDGHSGAQMYEHFKQINYDAEDYPLHMIDYKISTFGGQSGAPVLRKDGDELVAVGTHVYGGGAGGSHSDNSIKGDWGSNYAPFISLFNEDKSAIQKSEVFSNSHTGEESAGAFATPITVEVPLLS